jgi:flagellar biosynthesis/type III secretory pathway protein FliH
MVTKRYLEEKWLKPQRERLRREGLEEGRQKGRQEGRKQERQAWIDWNSRRQEAEAQGRPFNEPPPSS